MPQGAQGTQAFGKEYLLGFLGSRNTALFLHRFRLRLRYQGVMVHQRVSVETYRRWLKIILFVIARMLLARIISMTGDNRAELPVEPENAMVITVYCCDG